ncbi:hypothetical protein BCR34DRAFT_598219 [Clohesyomyces aquaticus]|uniref:Uncharacterized protein n=1 Tax=Clohesyomyces aquaticus TaxID=1231657 RepID=A0A1Y1ZZK3_9PLEO|nr:hypothetical protein BCR34DRAFT_598219 [Clohesyomyces aquaticus]
MADNPSRSLLADSKTRGLPTGKRNTRKLPLLVATFTALSLACTFGTILTLVISNDDEVTRWKIRVSVYVGFFQGLYNILLGGLLSLGVAITWWRTIQHGTTLKRLHYIQASASPKDFWAGMKAGSAARKVALVAMLIFIVKLSNNPIAQRATKTRSQMVPKERGMIMHIANRIEDGWYGHQGTFEKIPVLQTTLLNTSIPTENQKNASCPDTGICEALVAAAGYNYGCTSTSEKLNLLDSKNENSSIFEMNIEMNWDFGEPIFYSTTKYISSIDGACVGTLTTDTCNLIPATIWYPITIRNDSITVDFRTLLSSQRAVVSNYTSEADKNKNRTDPTTQLGPLTGLLAAWENILRAEALLGKKGAYFPNTDPGLSTQWPDVFHAGSVSTETTIPEFAQQNCPLLWNSPRDYLLQTFLDFSFRSAYIAASDTSDSSTLQEYTAVFRETQLWYSTDYGWLAATTLVMVIGMAAAMVLIWGWWELDRYVSMSPLETGRAFGATILLSAGQEKESKGIIDEIGNERVAHDGEELVWNGTVYASGRWEGGAVPTLRGRMGDRVSGESGEGSLRGSPRELEGESPSRLSVRNVRGHRRGMSSVSNGGSGGSNTSFEHSLGASTRKWFGGPEGGGTVKQFRQRSGSGSASAMPLLPLSLTPGGGGGGGMMGPAPGGIMSMKAYNNEPPRPRSYGSESPQLPPIAPSGSLKITPMSLGGGGRRGSVGEGSGSGGSSGKRPLSSITERNSMSPKD